MIRLTRASATVALLVALLALAPAAAQDRCDGAVQWNGIVPLCLHAGEKYRILFVTGNRPKWNDVGDTPAPLNHFVQREAARANHFTSIASGFRVLGSHKSGGNARENTQTVPDAHGPGERIFYFRANKVADNYADLYDGRWDSHSPTTQFGTAPSVSIVLTGSNDDGKRDSDFINRHGDDEIQWGNATSSGDELDWGNNNKNARFHRDSITDEAAARVYALSAVLTDPTHAATGRPTIDDLTPLVGDVLTADEGDIADQDGLPADWPTGISWQWEESDPGTDSSWDSIEGATEKTFTVTRAQAARRLRVRAEFTDAFGKTEVRRSCIDADDEGCADRVPTRVPNLVSIERNGSGILSEGQQFRIDATRANATPHRVQVQMVFRDGARTGLRFTEQNSEICKRTSNERINVISFTFEANQKHFNNIRRRICPDDDPDPQKTIWVTISSVPQGYEVDPDKGAVELIVERNDVGPPNATGKPAIDNPTPRFGKTLRARPDNIDDPQGLSDPGYLWRWEESDVGADSSWDAIPGATEWDFTPTVAQAGRKLRVRVDFVDDAGNPEFRHSSPTGRVPNAVWIERDGSGRIAEGDAFRIDAARLGDTSDQAQARLVFRHGAPDGAASAEVCNRDGDRIGNVPFTFSADRDRFAGIVRYICDDDDPELRESVWVVLDENRLPDGYQVDPDRRAVEIPVERSDVEVSIADAEARAGRPVEFEVSLNLAIDVAVLMRYSTVGDSADGDDYQGISNAPLVVPAGARSALLSVATTDDDEEEETFGVILRDDPLPAGVSFGDKSATGTILPNTGSLDVDGNGTVGLLTDGLLLVRYLIDIRGPELTNLALADDAHEDRDTHQEIAAYLQGLVDGDVLDVDGNGAVGLLTDGLLIVRYLIDIRGSALTEGAAAGDAHEDRNEPAEIAAYLDSLLPPQ